MSPQHRPQQPTYLLSHLRDAYQYPYPDFLREAGDAEQLALHLDQSFDDLIAAAKGLDQLTPESSHWEVLRYMLEVRFSSLAHQDKIERFLNVVLPEFIARVKELPPLVTRAGLTVRGAPRKRPLVRLMVTVICWHVANVERLPLRAGFDDEGRSSSRLANLVRATLAGMGIHLDDAGLGTEIKNAKRLPLMGMNYWDLIPSLPPRSA